MKRLERIFSVEGLFVLLSAIFVFVGTASALEIVLEPASVSRKVGDKVRVGIYADGAQDLISMGVKLSFNKTVLQVDSAEKYEEDADTGWVMDGDGNPATTDDQYRTPPREIDNANGEVTMIGGNLNGESTTGLNGKVFLGWIIFDTIANGTSNLYVDLAKYHPENPTKTFNNFVKLDGTIDEPTNAGNNLGVICVADDVCHADITGDGAADMQDWLKFGENWGQTDCDEASEYCECDLNGDGACDMQDWLRFGEDWGRTDCPTCP